MNIRITDLLDDYVDDSVKLTPPEAFERGGSTPEPAGNGRGSRLYKPLLVAATLMLVISGAVALGLGFQRSSGPGGALAEGNEAPMETFSLGALSQEESTEELEESAQEAATAWIGGTVDVRAYRQAGNQLTFNLTLSPVPEDMVAEADACSLEAVVVEQAENVDAAPTLSYMTMDIDSLDDSGTLSFHGTAELPEETDFLSFYVRLRGSDGSILISDNAATLRLTGFTNYATGGVRLFDIMDPYDDSVLGTVKWCEVTETQMRVLFELPTPEEYTGEETDTQLWDASHSCVNGLYASNVILLMENGDEVALDLEESEMEVLGTEFENEDGSLSTQTLVTFDILGSPISPLEINLVVTEERPVETTLPTLSGDDGNGDGKLSAEVSSELVREDGSVGVITGFSIDLETNEFTWAMDIPELETMLYGLAPDGDMGTAIRDMDFNQAHIDWYGAFLEAFMREAQVVFADGSSCNIGNGDVPGYDPDTGLFFETSILPVDPDAPCFEIAYLILDGVTYELR